MNAEKAKVLLLYTYIAPLSCWMFDVFTTFYAIRTGIAVEMNPLGWPLGALGALIFYIPAYTFTNMLLFKIHSKYSPWTAIPITMLALALGAMNLLAGIHNLQIAKTPAR